jgi:hypothetical protein
LTTALGRLEPASETNATSSLSRSPMRSSDSSSTWRLACARSPAMIHLSYEREQALEFCSTRPQAARDVQQSSRPSCPWKWPWTSGNGGFPGLFAFSAYRLEMIFSRLVEIRECAISKCPAHPPLRGRPALDVAGRSRPWGRQAGGSSTYAVVNSHAVAHAAISVSSSGIRSKI